MFFWTRFDGVLVVDVDGTDLVPNQNPNTVSLWLSAIESLEDRGYTSNHGLKIGCYVLTKQGRAVARQLTMERDGSATTVAQEHDARFFDSSSDD